jgi:hypothetical protein
MFSWKNILSYNLASLLVQHMFEVTKERKAAKPKRVKSSKEAKICQGTQQ